MKHIIYIIIALSFLAAACSEDSVNTYGETEYIYFENLELNYSFAFDPGVNLKDIPVVVKLIGNSTPYERPIELAIDSTSANVGNTDFELLPAKLQAGRYSDTVYIRVHKSDKFSDNIGFVRFVIKGNEYFTPGPTKNTRFSLAFSDILLQPAWWDKAIERDYLGTYSEKKYRHFIIANDGVHNLGEMGNSEKRAYTLIFKRYIEENNLTEEDGSPMILTIKE